MSFPKYDRYKDSGVEWLGEVPQQWELLKLKRICLLKSGENITSEQIQEEDNFPVFGGNGLRGYTDKYTHDGHYALIGRQGALCGNVNYAAGRFWASEHAVVVLKTKDFVTRWLGELLRTMNLNQYSIASAQPGLSVEVIGNLFIPLPPLPEQRSIAAFLDRETTKIDELIAEQRQLIDLLKEKRQAVISHAVTKGLNPDAPMKDSAIEWLGEVPEHWDITRIKWYFDTASGGTPDTSKQDLYYAEEEGIPWIRTTDLGNDVLSSFEVSITEKALCDTACAVLPVETVMVAMYGGDGTIGKNGILAIPATINQAVCGLLPNSSFVSTFTFRYIQFYRPHWMIGAESSRKDPNISQALIRNAPILRPPLEEQNQIVTFIERETTKLDELIAETHHAIALLQERRTALISAAVTGKIDVRSLV